MRSFQSPPFCTLRVKENSETDPATRLPDSLSEQLALQIEKERPGLTQLIRRKLGPRLQRWVEADDIVQETLAIVCENVEQVSALPPSKLRAWLRTVAERRILLLARSMRPKKRPRRRSTMPISGILQLDGTELDEAPARSQRKSEDAPGEVQRDLVRHLRTLTAGQREAFLLREVLAVPWETVGFALRRNEDAARRLHGRALRRLEETLPRTTFLAR